MVTPPPILRGGADHPGLVLTFTGAGDLREELPSCLGTTNLGIDIVVDRALDELREEEVADMSHRSCACSRGRGVPELDHHLIQVAPLC